ncbi:MAG: PA2169 family four-helix-bundle protein [Methylotenera sp.]|uniref:PA2169 family four-helix-bundle protein n=1 Tax=Methylotenera sp. TaxID=2051956 RepID=UPI002488B8A7|nr:PA2169 family four-helix-bundle protein [Methylotenera sp.]MDI1309871.1 PA2169 family four-helix-bundle protein [Methylotenera sp.]
MLDNEHTINELNDLILVMMDGEEGFYKSAEITTDPKIKSFLYHRSEETTDNILELQSLVKDLGGAPAAATSIGGYLYQKWIDLKIVILSNDRRAILEELFKEGERAESAYLDAIEKDLSPQAVLIVLRHLSHIDNNQKQIRELMNALDKDL